MTLVACTSLLALLGHCTITSLSQPQSLQNGDRMPLALGAIFYPFSAPCMHGSSSLYLLVCRGQCRCRSLSACNCWTSVSSCDTLYAGVCGTAGSCSPCALSPPCKARLRSLRQPSFAQGIAHPAVHSTNRAWQRKRHSTRRPKPARQPPALLRTRASLRAACCSRMRHLSRLLEPQRSAPDLLCLDQSVMHVLGDLCC